MWWETDFTLCAFEESGVTAVVDVGVAGRYVLPSTICVLYALVRWRSVCSNDVVEDKSRECPGSAEVSISFSSDSVE